MSKNNTANAIEALKKALKDKNLAVRKAAAEALGKIGNEAEADVLINALCDKETSVRIAAVKALGQVGNAQTIDFIVPMLNDMDEKIREAAACALGKEKFTSAVEPLRQALIDKNGDVRKAAASALCVLGESQWAEIDGTDADYIYLVDIIGLQAKSPLIKCLASTNKVLRKNAAKKLILLAKDNPDEEILNAKMIETIKKPHTDSINTTRHSDDVIETGSPSCKHGFYSHSDRPSISRHTDDGVGVDFNDF